MLEGIDPNYAVDIDHNDEIRIIRALEIYKNSGKKLSEIFSNNPTNGIKEKYEVIQFGIKTDREILHERIKARLHEMIDNGLIEETENILNDFNISESHPIRKAVNYKQSIEYINGKYSKDILLDRALYATRQLAKRQVTWMKSWDDYINVDIEDIKTFTNKVKNSLSSL
jgi:tRNA dimethylallyltransferase